jgi:uncharacterized protein YcfJ
MKLMYTTACAAIAAGLAGLTASAHAADYATVVSSTPVVQPVTVPRQECTDVQRYVQPQPSGAGALVGAIVGGVVGNQFGHGMGRAAATGIGAVAGSALGNQVELSNQPAGVVPSRQCRTVQFHEQRVVGYDVVYEFNGQRYSTRLDRDPGAHLAIDVRPSEERGRGRSGTAVPPSYSAAPTYVEPAPRYVEPAPRYVEPAPRYVEPAPRYVEPATIGYYEQAPQIVAPGPVYYESPARYIAPAVIGLGIGYWMGNRWYGGHRHHHHGWRGHRGR